jgi:cytoskeletal protein CcmA (bactofilin family)
MMFHKSNPKINMELAEVMIEEPRIELRSDDVDTVVGPSVNVEGDFASEGNIIVKGTVSGSVHTSKNLLVEQGAKIMANVRAGSAHIAGEIKGNLKIQDSLELSATARIVGDIEAAVLMIEPGALLFGRVAMPGLESDAKPTRSGRSGRRNEELNLQEDL